MIAGIVLITTRRLSIWATLVDAIFALVVGVDSDEASYGAKSLMDTHEQRATCREYEFVHIHLTDTLHRLFHESKTILVLNELFRSNENIKSLSDICHTLDYVKPSLDSALS
jgi:hypothetical protein